LEQKRKSPNSLYPYLFKGRKYSRLVESGFSVNQAWGALHKAWLGFSIAKHNYESDRKVHYAKVIQKIQREIGIKVRDFSNIGLPASEAYMWDDYEEFKDNQPKNENDKIQPQRYEKTASEIDYNKYQEKRAKQIRDHIEEYSKSAIND
jgi:hypothetical protein